MIFLSDFLKSAPKKFVAQIYKKQNTQTGVIQGKEVFQKTLAWATDKTRLSKKINQLAKSEKILLLAIYISEKRGLLESDMYTFAEGIDPDTISDLLFQLESDLLIHCRRGDNYSFHGFADFYSWLVPLLFPDSTAKSTRFRHACVLDLVVRWEQKCGDRLHAL